MKSAVIFLLKCYRNYLSPFKLQCCRFYPSCSQYTIEAIERYGLFKGTLKGMRRLFHCHPFSKGGYDPVA